MAKYKSALPKLPERGWFKKGDKGEEVKKMQRAVNWANGGSIIAPLKIDGEVGNLTIAAISFMEELHHMTIDGEFGIKCLNLIKSFDLNGRWRACNWAVSVSKDNRFTYGAGKRAHRSGCYFCGTNTGPAHKNKERRGEPHVVKDSQGNGHTYHMTYCCNPFITAAYAHGAKDPVSLKKCKNGSSFGMSPKEWEQSPNFKRLGKAKDVPFEKLYPGDVIMVNADNIQHVWMYLGGDKYVEAGSEGWGSNTIASKHGAKRNYKKYQKMSPCYVVRYMK